MEKIITLYKSDSLTITRLNNKVVKLDLVDSFNVYEYLIFEEEQEHIKILKSYIFSELLNFENNVNDFINCFECSDYETFIKDLLRKDLLDKVIDNACLEDIELYNDFTNLLL